MASSKSADIPIESSGSASPVRSRSASWTARSWANDARACAGVESSAAIVIRPTTGIRRQAAIASASLGIACGDQPCFVSSPEVFT